MVQKKSMDPSANYPENAVSTGCDIVHYFFLSHSFFFFLLLLLSFTISFFHLKCMFFAICLSLHWRIVYDSLSLIKLAPVSYSKLLAIHPLLLSSPSKHWPSATGVLTVSVLNLTFSSSSSSWLAVSPRQARPGCGTRGSRATTSAVHRSGPGLEGPKQWGNKERIWPAVAWYVFV